MVALLLLLCFFCLQLGAARDTITSSQYVKDPDAIVSAGNKFKLGFFSPVNSTNRYVGIWFSSFTPITRVWVANRNKPLNDSSGVMTISGDGNLVVLNGQKETLWSSNVSNGVSNSSARLMDDGNLVLRDIGSGNRLWESFQEPSDTMITNMRLTAKVRTGEKTLLSSWRSPSDPSIGTFSVGIDPVRIPQCFIWNHSHPIYRTGPWNGQVFIGIPGMNSVNINGFDIEQDGNGTFTLILNSANESYIGSFVLSYDGNFNELYWDYGKEEWVYVGRLPNDECDVYGKCGSFGICNAKYSPICSCMKGFEPKDADEWNSRNWTSGCVRRRPMQCERIQYGGEPGKEDGFLKLRTVKVPDFADRSLAVSEQTCRENCMNNCSCIAYAYYTGIRCMLWWENLTDIRKFPSGGADLYVRLAYSELDNRTTSMKVIIGLTVVVGAIISAICVFCMWRRIAHYRERKKRSMKILLDESMMQDDLNQAKLPLLSLPKLVAATNNFDIANKLGQGGFGPVYKGRLPDGQEIAVKRLSRASGQGLEEFMNEVVVISKLQHRNLVRLLGCCVEGEEKMLVYEYMPNKSLDAFLFDPLRKQLLDWNKRFDIVDGICRGLLYLHRDSRLKIIHRDLKASNILLDENLNPKISDFGMARIFGGNEDQANTIRVVGTYGYMSPEYAIQGRFSEKSDVFSFGVLLLEIASGRKNTSFYDCEQVSSLIGFAWKSWNEGNIGAIVDPVISNPSFEVEVFRCINIGLLCVQELARDRPTISTVISMLNSEIVDLPAPKQSAFAERFSYLDKESSEQNKQRYSINNVSITALEAR
ncbi:hypothetical protein POPTR_011G039300v4 [Populus trichocarpa]|uniref:Receptor-like serine/threonine-protein kinase n=1 Tax=Populus trichocarpa TaxID=3694 RepID=A0A2K1YF89_POPTR|nr:hypothetical protein BDE02_11G031500 [Populus trichocarpa]PNT11697.1 hypothetical protein POPTR_011G039300v4 [Populus trichocarpa]|eukprot:XP_024437505.1 G-type lectin S-receptor-like serine/threonine-protein kinase At1g11330 [Populus trichocarpa]